MKNKEKDAAKAMMEEQVLLCLYQNLESMDFITTMMGLLRADKS